MEKKIEQIVDINENQADEVVAENQLSTYYSQKLQEILDNYEIEGNLPDDAHIEIYIDDYLVGNTKEGEQSNNVNFSAIDKLEVAQGLSKGTIVNGLENLRIEAVSPDKTDILFATDDKGIVQTNIAKPLENSGERLNNLLESKILKAKGLRELTEVVSELSAQLQLQNELLKEQQVKLSEQDQFIEEQKDFNDFATDLVADSDASLKQLEHQAKTKEIADFFVRVASDMKGKQFNKRGDEYTVSANAKGDVRIWDKQDDLIYSQSQNSTDLNKLTDDDLDKFMGAKEHHDKAMAEKINEKAQAQLERIKQEPQLQEQTQNQLPQKPITRVGR